MQVRVKKRVKFRDGNGSGIQPDPAQLNTVDHIYLYPILHMDRVGLDSLKIQPVSGSPYDPIILVFSLGFAFIWNGHRVIDLKQGRFREGFVRRGVICRI